MQFQGWVERAAGADGVPVFVGLNAPFDWSFINYYFHYLLKSNPFGFAALDIKALYMGRQNRVGPERVQARWPLGFTPNRRETMRR